MTESQSDTNGMKRIYVLQPRFIFHRFAFIPRFHLRDSGRYPPPYLVAGAVSFHFILFFHSNSIPSPLPTHTNQLETIERRKEKTVSRSNYRGCWCCFFGDVFGTKKGDLQRFYEAARLRKNASWCRIIEGGQRSKDRLSLSFSLLFQEKKKESWKQDSTRDGILINMKTTTTVPVMPETGWS